MLSPSTYAIYDRILALYSDGESDQALGVVKQHLSEDSDNGRLWELLGTLAYAEDDYELAQSALERASTLMPLSPRGQVVLGKCYDRSGHYEAAAAIYRYVAQLPELAIDLLEPLASGLGRSGANELALDICRRAARLMPDNPDPLVGIAHYMRRLRRPIELILPVMFCAHHLDPENVEYRITLAWMLHEVGRSEEGAHLLERVPCGQFTCVRCLTLMQRVFESVGDEEKTTACRNRLSVLTSESSAENDASPHHK